VKLFILGPESVTYRKLGKIPKAMFRYLDVTAVEVLVKLSTIFDDVVTLIFQRAVCSHSMFKTAQT